MNLNLPTDGLLNQKWSKTGPVIMNEEKDKIVKLRFPKEETKALYQKTIDELFESAQKTDEREFVIANLYFNGLMQLSDDYDIRKELDKTLGDFFSLLGNPDLFQADGLLIKVFIFLYCHILEFYLFYIFIYGLLDVCCGESFDLNVFEKKTPDYQVIIRKIKNIIENGNPDYIKAKDITDVCKPLFSDKMTNWRKINMILSRSKEAKSEVGKIISSFYNNELRNAFSHNHYTVSNKGVMLIELHQVLSIPELLEQITNCFTFYQYLTVKSEQVIKTLCDNPNNKFTGKYGSLELETVKEENGKCHFRVHGSSIGKTL